MRPQSGKDRTLGAKGEATRQRLMDAAEEIFGTKGFYHSSIGDITTGAGVAQGTFYLYFPSKLDIFRALVEHLSHILRTETELATQSAKDRLEAERLGIEAFYRFVDRHRNLYRIVRQVEVVDEELFKRYYRRIASGYVKKLAQAIDRGEIRRMDPELAAWCLMGANDYTVCVLFSGMRRARRILQPWSISLLPTSHPRRSSTRSMELGLSPSPG